MVKRRSTVKPEVGGSLGQILCMFYVQIMSSSDYLFRCESNKDPGLVHRDSLIVSLSGLKSTSLSELKNNLASPSLIYASKVGTPEIQWVPLIRFPRFGPSKPEGSPQTPHRRQPSEVSQPPRLEISVSCENDIHRIRAALNNR